MLGNKYSIRTKLIRLIMLISSTSLIAGLAVLFAYEIISYRQSIKNELEIVAKMLAQNLTASLAFDNIEDAKDLLSSLNVQDNITDAVIYKPDGNVFVQIAFRENAGATENTLGPSTDFIDATFPIIQGDKTLGKLYVRRSTADVSSRVMIYLLLILGVLLVCFALSYYLSRRFEKGISTPIIALASLAEMVSKDHNYSVRAELPDESEIASLTRAFNNMLSKIEGQSSEIQTHARDLETKVYERTLEIKRQRDFAETVINSSLVLIAVFDSNMRFVAFNKRCEIEFGLRRDDVLGKTMAEAMPSVVGSPAYKSVIKALAGEPVHNPKYQSPVSGNFYESFTTPLRNERDEVYAVLLTAHNITDLVAATDSLILKNEELKRKNEELEQFAYVASHDLQEPLRKIQVFADRAERMAENNPDSMVYIRKIMSSAERMAMLIKDVLQYSLLSQQQQSVTKVNLNLVIHYVKSDFELLISEKSASISTNELPIVSGNQLQLHQLFANLINNAIKFNENRPQITITSQRATQAEYQHYRLDPDGTFHKILVQDNGIGFERQFKDRIFSIFQRLHSREKYVGTGIGLALCRKIVENHGGRIDVESEVGKGTTFIIFLPSTLNDRSLNKNATA